MPYTVGDYAIRTTSKYSECVKVIRVYDGGAYYEVERTNGEIVSCTEEELVTS